MKFSSVDETNVVATGAPSTVTIVEATKSMPNKRVGSVSGQLIGALFATTIVTIGATGGCGVTDPPGTQGMQP